MNINPNMYNTCAEEKKKKEIKLKGTASYTVREDFYENLYRQQARLKWVYLFGGISIGIAIGLTLPAKAVTMSAHVEESPMRECINKCGYNIK